MMFSPVMAPPFLLTARVLAISGTFVYLIHPLASDLPESCSRDDEEFPCVSMIEPSTSAWLSPFILVNKPNGGKRLCFPYRRVIIQLVKDVYPMPEFDEVVENAAGREYYKSLNFKLILKLNSMKQPKI